MSKCVWKKVQGHFCKTSCGKYSIISFDKEKHNFPTEGETCPDCGKRIVYAEEKQAAKERRKKQRKHGIGGQAVSNGNKNNDQ